MLPRTFSGTKPKGIPLAARHARDRPVMENPDVTSAQEAFAMTQQLLRHDSTRAGTKIKTRYFCKHHGKNHDVEFPGEMMDNADHFPFPYIFLHGSEDGLDDLLTILYIDKNGKVRSADQQDIGALDIVSKGQLVSIVNTLVDQIDCLSRENDALRSALAGAR